MVISRITSGLGNQLFQYACGRAVSLRHGVPLKLDLQNFTQHKNRRYALDAFAIEATEATPGEVRMALRYDTFWHRALTPRTHQRVLRERTMRVDPAVLQAGPEVYLAGYWQSPTYFEDVETEIRREFTWKIPFPPQSVRWLEQIDQKNAVAIHVRRGDYVSNPDYARRFGTLPLSYYERALRYLAERLEGLHGFVFSDEPDWVKANFPTTIPLTIVQGNTDTEDLRLMSACRYHVIANSTFSWWGAWLNPHADKLVLTPARFFHDPKLNTQDLLPERWIRV
ncbi:MAG: alpha-1,2-fucosyltransferase [Cytophagaceae bacterium]|nr:alpha-1,2-fucosyltransferase [Cytophagaceae bacterium]